MTVDVGEISKRVVELRKYLGFSQKVMAEKTNLGRSFISHIEAGTQKPSFDFIVKIINSFNVSADWLLIGEGQMFLAEKSDVIKQMTKEHLKLIENLQSKTPENQEKIISSFNNLLNID